MPTRDRFHDAVRNALEKDGWTITDDPLTIRFGKVDLHIDLGAEQMLAAQKQGRKIAVEIKGFIGPSFVYDFHLAVGQFMNYQIALEAEKPEYVLYLAVPLDVYDGFFNAELVQTALNRYQIKLLVYQVESGVIAKWKE